MSYLANSFLFLGLIFGILMALGYAGTIDIDVISSTESSYLFGISRVCWYHYYGNESCTYYQCFGYHIVFRGNQLRMHYIV